MPDTSNTKGRARKRKSIFDLADAQRSFCVSIHTKVSNRVDHILWSIFIMRTSGGARNYRNPNENKICTEGDKHLDELDSSSDEASTSSRSSDMKCSELEDLTERIGRECSERYDINKMMPYIPHLVDRPTETLRAWVRREYHKAKRIRTQLIEPLIPSSSVPRRDLELLTSRTDSHERDSPGN